MLQTRRFLPGIITLFLFLCLLIVFGKDRLASSAAEPSTAAPASTTAIPPSAEAHASTTGANDMGKPSRNVSDTTFSNASTLPLKLFGADFFREDASAFQPNADLSVPDDYVLGAGDTLAVHCWFGANEYERSSNKITPTGEIYLNLLGTISLSHRTLNQARDYLRKRYTKYYTAFSLTVDLVGQRTIPVQIVGEVKKPGKYLLSSLATVFTAIYSAGGPNDIGSLRHIALMRGKQRIGEVDIYDYLLKGIDVDLSLQAGDTILIPPASVIVSLTGEIRRPARYELNPNTSLTAALVLAGGATPNGSSQLQVIRSDAGNGRQVLNLQLPADSTFPLRDGDVITLHPVPEQIANAVQVTGEVNHPGEYAIEKAATVSALLKLAEGVKPEAYLMKADLTRVLANHEREVLPINLADVLSGNRAADIALQPRDVLTVYARNDLLELLDTVTIEGAVVKPGEYPYRKGMRVVDLVAQAFGVTKNAYLPLALLYRFDKTSGVSMASLQLGSALGGDEAANTPLHPRDRIVIRSLTDANLQNIAVKGEVVIPGTYSYYKGMSVSDALFLAGGTTENAALDHALLYRIDEQTYREEVRDIALRKALAHQPTDDLVLQNHDRLVIFSIKQQGDFQHVTVEGAVSTPGEYPYAQGMRLHQLLLLANNLRRDAYTQRANLFRYHPDNSVELMPINLGKALDGASSTDDPELQPRDRLVIASQTEKNADRFAKIDGFVRKPGAYVITEGMKVSDLLDLGCGLMPEAESQAFLHRRVNGKELVTPLAIQRNDDKLMLPIDPVLAPDDLVTVRSLPEYSKLTDSFHIEGEISHPGSYPVYPGLKSQPNTVYKALLQAGGVLPTGFVQGIVLYRKRSSVQSTQGQQQLERTLAALDATAGTTPPRNTAANDKKESDVPVNPAIPTSTKSSAPSSEEIAHQQNVANVSQSLAQTLVSGSDSTLIFVIPPRSVQMGDYALSIPIDAQAILQSKGKIDLALEADDYLYIPRQPTTITVLGGVITPGSLLYTKGKDLQDYINALGGFSRDADPSRLIVMHQNGQVKSARRVRALLPGDIVIVPTKHIVKSIHQESEFNRSLTILSQLALTALPFIR